MTMQPNPLSGLSVQLRIPGASKPLYELRLHPGYRCPVGIELVTREIERQLCQLYPAYNTELQRKAMREDPVFAAYEAARIELASRYPDCGVPTHVL